MSACRTTCKASTRWIAKAANSLIAGALALGLAACERPGDAAQSCMQMRETFDAAFKDAVGAATRKAVEEKKRFLKIGQDTYLAMERKGCCKQEGVCPPMNVQ